MGNPFVVPSLVVVVLVTIGIGVYGLRFARTTSDFLVAVGWTYVRFAERNEQDFTALVRRPEQ